MSEENAKKEKKILVVGDWFVDEHWVVARERSITATRRGKSHYHVLQGRNSHVQALCGAGIDATLLNAVGKTAQEPFEVHGLGAWHPADGGQIEMMLKPEGVEPLNQYSLAGSPPRTATRLHNLDELSPKLRPRLTTTRIFRVYFQDADGVDLVQRFDWETPPNPQAASASGRRFWITEDIKRPNTLEQLSPDAIVVRDHVKGVVSPKLIRRLVEMYGGKPKLEWYIYSKDWHLRQPNPGAEEWILDPESWLAELQKQDHHNAKQNVRLFFVPQVAAHNALYEPHRHVNNWCLACRRPSWRAMKVMDALAKAVESGNQEPSVVVVPENSLVFARAPAQGTQNLLIGWSDSPNPLEIGVPVGSMLFAAIVSLMIAQPGDDADEWLPQALAFTEDWADDESGRISKLVGWKPKDLNTLWKNRKQKPAAHCSNPHPWQDASTEWQQARDVKRFVVRRIQTEEGREENEERIELWRAMTDVDGFICLAERKRAAIREIKRQLARFKEFPERHVSIMLEAEPGSGKTSLLDKLAREADMQLLAFNITQMVSLSEILDCFDSIVSRQSSREDSKYILAFFDEINAKLAGELVYGKFLDPIDRGTYVRGGKTLYIRPCVWVFAGTKDERDKDPAKHSDFTSRLTLPPLDFSTLAGDLATLERRYIGAALLQRVFPDVQSASKLVLDSFDLLYDKSPRECEKFVREFRNIRQGEVRASNVPVEWLEKSCENAGAASRRQDPGAAGSKDTRPAWMGTLQEWKERAAKQEKEEMVRIVRKPEPWIS